MQHICALLKTRLEIGTEMSRRQLAEKDMPVKDCDDNSHNMTQKNNQYCEEKPALSETPSRDDVSSPDGGNNSEGKAEGGIVTQCSNLKKKVPI